MSSPWSSIRVTLVPKSLSGIPVYLDEVSREALVADLSIDAGTSFLINVKEHGAIGDSITDDAAAFQAAFDAAAVAVAAAGGAVVLVPPGTYRIGTPLTIREDNIAVIGYLPTADNFNVGQGTILTPTENFPDDSYVLDVGDGGAKSRPVANIRLIGFGIAKLSDDTLSNTVHGLRFMGYRGYVRDVFIDQMSGNACVIEGDNDGTPWNTYETKFHNCHFRRSGGIGLWLSHDTADMHFVDCVIGGNDGVGIYVTGGASCHFVSCHSTGNLNNLHVDGGGSRSKWVGCKFEASDEHNVNLDATDGGATDLHFIGCNFNMTVALTQDNVFDNVIVQRSSGGNTISGVLVGCTFQQITGTNNPRYHVNLTSAVAVNWRIDGNKVDGNAQSGAYNRHANSVRCTINGHGINVGDPATTGQWNANGEEGIRVFNSSGNTFHTYINGSWRAG